MTVFDSALALSRIRRRLNICPHPRSTRKSFLWVALSVLSALPLAAKPYSFIALHDQNKVAIYDHALSSWIATVTVGTAPMGVASDASQRNVFISNHSANSVTIIRTANRSVAATIPVGSRPLGIAVSPVQPRAYVANFGAATVSVIDTATNTVILTINVGNQPAGLAMTPTGDRLFVANAGDGTVSVIDTASNTVVSTITVSDASNPKPRPYALAFVSVGGANRLLVANNNAGKVSVFDGATYAPTATIPVGPHPTALAVVNPNKVYVLNSFNSTVTPIDPFAGAALASPIAAPSGAIALATSSDGSLAAIAAYPNKFAVINTTTNAVTAGPLVSGGPNAPVTIGNFIVNPPFECALDINNDNAFNGQDAILIIRYLAGLRGSALVSGFPALDATAAQSLLASLNLDADGDGQSYASTDGILLSRAASGVVAAALIANARNTGFVGVRDATGTLNWIETTHGADCLP